MWLSWTDKPLSQILPPEEWKYSKRDTFRDLKTEKLSENTYYVPENPHFESVDAVVPPDTAVQITVSLKHPVKMCGLQYVKNALRCQKLFCCSRKYLRKFSEATLPYTNGHSMV